MLLHVYHVLTVISLRQPSLIEGYMYVIAKM